MSKLCSAITAAVTLTLFLSVACTSCGKEPIEDCKNVVCYNGGSCIHGICTCPPGYEGRQCEKKK